MNLWGEKKNKTTMESLRSVLCFQTFLRESPFGCLCPAWSHRPQPRFSPGRPPTSFCISARGLRPSIQERTTGTCLRLTEHKWAYPDCKRSILTLITMDAQQTRSSWRVVPRTEWPPSLEPSAAIQLKKPAREIHNIFLIWREWAGIQ